MKKKKKNENKKKKETKWVILLYETIKYKNKHTHKIL